MISPFLPHLIFSALQLFLQRVPLRPQWIPRLFLPEVPQVIPVPRGHVGEVNMQDKPTVPSGKASRSPAQEAGLSEPCLPEACRAQPRGAQFPLSTGGNHLEHSVAFAASPLLFSKAPGPAKVDLGRLGVSFKGETCGSLQRWGGEATPTNGGGRHPTKTGPGRKSPALLPAVRSLASPERPSDVTNSSQYTQPQRTGASGERGSH